jgi:hypothetical protein
LYSDFYYILKSIVFHTINTENYHQKENNMAAQQGFVYEENACDFLKPMGLVPEKFKPAGAGHNQPDLMLLVNGKEAGCELKITAASAG